MAKESITALVSLGTLAAVGAQTWLLRRQTHVMQMQVEELKQLMVQTHSVTTHSPHSHTDDGPHGGRRRCVGDTSAQEKQAQWC